MFKDIENHFGRLLSPIEVDTISTWEKEYNPDLIKEALATAKAVKVRNIRYIGSILHNWKMNSIKSLQDLEQHRNNQAFRFSRSCNSDTEDNEKQKELIKKLYCS